MNWSYNDIHGEKYLDTGFADYVLYINGNPVLVIEAKRRYIIDINLLRKEKLQHLKISGSALKNAVESITSYFEAAGCSEKVIDVTLCSLLSLKLIELYDVSVLELSIEQKVAISHKGFIHIDLASNNNVFFLSNGIGYGNY